MSRKHTLSQILLSKRGRTRLIGGLLGVGAWLTTLTLRPWQARATTFSSPTPAPVSAVINQPYVTFQTPKAARHFLQIGDNVPIWLVIVVLVLLLGTLIFSLSSLNLRR
jgi:hypothetical protein